MSDARSFSIANASAALKQLTETVTEQVYGLTQWLERLRERNAMLRDRQMLMNVSVSDLVASAAHLQTEFFMIQQQRTKLDDLESDCHLLDEATNELESYVRQLGNFILLIIYLYLLFIHIYLYLLFIYIHMNISHQNSCSASNDFWFDQDSLKISYGHS